MDKRELIKTDQNQTTFSGMVKLIQDIVLLLFFIEIVGFLILGTYYLQYYPSAKEAYLHGFFSVIRSEERRVGKECRSGSGRYSGKEKRERGGGIVDTW